MSYIVRTLNNAILIEGTPSLQKSQVGQFDWCMYHQFSVDHVQLLQGVHYIVSILEIAFKHQFSDNFFFFLPLLTCIFLVLFL